MNLLLTMRMVLAVSLIAAVAPGQTSAQTLTPALPAAAGISGAQLARIKALQEQYVKDGQIAGSTMLIARKGKLVFFETFGNIDKEAGKPMPKDAIFRLNSMTKPIIAVAGLTLYEQGKYSLLDPVSKYIPEFKDMKVAVEGKDANGKRTLALVPAERQITVLDLFRHTNGMNNQGPRNEAGDLYLRRIGMHDHPLADGIKLMAGVPLVHQPGTGFDYSLGPDVIGRLIEIWSGKPLDVYLDEAVLKPLHMVDTGFWVPEEKWNRIAVLYDAGPDGKVRRIEGAAQDTTVGNQQPRAPGAVQESIKKKPLYFTGSNGLLSTTMDYARFAEMLVSGGTLDGVRILSPETVALMGTDLLGDLPVYGGPMLPGYGFGLTVAVNRGPARTATVGTAGEYYWEGGSGSLFFVDPKEQLITVYMMQKRGGVGISRQYKRMLYSALTTREDGKSQ